MIVWRLTLKQHTTPDGEGARRYGGRWNNGTPVVYTSGTLSLAALEYLVHVDSDLLPDALVSVRATIPESLKIETIDPTHLPGDWKATIISRKFTATGVVIWANHAQKVLSSRVPSVSHPAMKGN